MESEIDLYPIKRAFATLFINHSVSIFKRSKKSQWWDSNSPSLCMNRKTGHNSAFNFNRTFWYSSCIVNTIFQGILSHPVKPCWLVQYSQSKPGPGSIKRALHSVLNLTILSKQRKKRALSRGKSGWYLVCLSAGLWSVSQVRDVQITSILSISVVSKPLLNPGFLHIGILVKAADQIF